MSLFIPFSICATYSTLSLYTVTIKSGADKITLTRGDGKILVQAKERIPASVGVVVELEILDNDGSDYSKTTMRLSA